MTARTKPCSKADARAYRDRAKAFLAVAKEAAATSPLDAAERAVCASVFVHAAISASDALCCMHVGARPAGTSHTEATRLLQQVSPDGDKLAQAFGDVIQVKNKAEYSAESVTEAELKRAARGAGHLVDAAIERVQ
jgi:hypothetical protein